MKTRTQLKAIARDILRDTITDLRLETATTWPLRLTPEDKEHLIELLETAKIEIKWSR